MMVIVDTPVWSFALRRRVADLSEKEFRLTQGLSELVREDRVQLLGSIRQEVLSGIREDSQFQRIKKHLHLFEDVMLAAEDYEEAARMCNLCKSSGIASTAVDMLICAVSDRRRWQIFSTDEDFVGYGRVLDLHLFSLS